MRARPRFKAWTTDSDGIGALEWSLDGTSSGCVSIDPAVARVARVVASKSDKNQAGVHLDPKWLLIQVGQPELLPVGFALEHAVSDPKTFAELAENVDLGIFDEVWVVWEMWVEGEWPALGGQATSVIVLPCSATPRHFLVYPEQVPRS
jgi:hypothetical protein